MRKTILLALMVVATAIGANAQIRYGIKGAANVANLSGDFTYEEKAKINGAIGGIVEFKLSDLVAVQPELMYSNQGALVNTINGTSIRHSIQYLQLPVMLKFRFLEEYSSIDLGPVVSYKIGEKLGGNKPVEDIAADYDFGVAAGLTYEFDGGIFVFARYMYGFLDVYDTGLLDTAYAQNRVLQIGLGYFF